MNLKEHKKAIAKWNYKYATGQITKEEAYNAITVLKASFYNTRLVEMFKKVPDTRVLENFDTREWL